MKPIKYHLLFLFIGSLIGFFLWSIIKLPFHNEYHIVGLLDEIRENPNNDIFRFIVFVSLPSILFSVFFLVNRQKKIPEITFRKIDKINSKPIELFIYFIFCLISGVFIIQENPFFDPFHEGESIGTAINYMNGKVPYQDFIFCHGLIQDPLRAVWGFELFGKSIGAFRTMSSILELITIILLSIFILRFFKGDVKRAGIALLLIILTEKTLDYIYCRAGNNLVSQMSIELGRDSTLYLFLISLSYMNNLISGEINKRWSGVIYVSTSFIPVMSFAYSIDRGFYLSGGFLIIFVVLLIFFFENTKDRIVFLIYSILGVSIGVIALFLVFKNGFDDFLWYVFVEMPTYKEFLDGKPYPINDHRFFVALVLQSALVLILTNRFFQLKNVSSSLSNTVSFFVKSNFLELSLVILSILFFRSVLGRSDLFHLRYGIHIGVILSFLLMIKNVKRDYIFSSKYYFSIIGATVIIFSFRIYSKNTFYDIFPLKKSDQQFVPTNFKRTIMFFKDETRKGKKIYSLSSEASWYYFLDQPCPTRFPVTYFAERENYQYQLINDLQNEMVSYILIDTKSINIDNINIFKRLPLVMNYLREKYIFYKKIDDKIIWIRKSKL